MAAHIRHDLCTGQDLDMKFLFQLMPLLKDISKGMAKIEEMSHTSSVYSLEAMVAT